jgi:hypothetical protein
MNRLFSSRPRALLTSACLVVAAAGLGLGARALYDGCCFPGAACCYPGSPCCAHAGVASR